MKNGISILSAIVLGFFVAKIGSFIVGYTSAFVMPKSFAPIMWLWEILVIQFLGFGATKQDRHLCEKIHIVCACLALYSTLKIRPT